ncbi:MAG: hemolysin III family protein [Clostridia bacterium]|nr:hemolysin III family protein [Clostridia bacterium]
MEKVIKKAAYTDAGKSADWRSNEKLCSFYTKGEEIFNAVSHIAGGAIGLAMWAVLAYLAVPDVKSVVAVSVFGLSIVVLYTMSSLYHFLHEGKAKYVFRTFDHCTIFLLIAGTYTPYCMIALWGTPFGLPVLITEWVCAIAGITMNAIAMRNKAVKVISMILYFVMGWLILIAVVPMVQTLSIPCLILLISGGVAYSGGIVFYALGKKVKYFHSVWHLFDIAGTVLQFASILLMVMM